MHPVSSILVADSSFAGGEFARDSSITRVGPLESKCSDEDVPSGSHQRPVGVLDDSDGVIREGDAVIRV